MGCVSSTPRGSNREVTQGDTPLATRRQLHSGTLNRLVYHSESRHLGNPHGSHTGKHEDEPQFDNSLASRAMSSSALLTSKSSLIEKFPGSPSFRFYLKKDSKLDSRKDSQLNEKHVSTPIREQKKGMLNKLHHPIDSLKSLLSNQEAQSTPNKKKKGWKSKFLTKKCKDSRNTAPPQLQALVTPPRNSSETAAVRLQKVTRGFLLRKNLQILRNIDATAKEIGKKIAKYEAILEIDKKARFSIEDKLIRLMSQLNSVRVAIVYKKKVILRIRSLQNTVNSIASRARNLYSDPIMVSSSENSMEEALIDGTCFVSVRGDYDKTRDSIGVERSEIVMDFDELTGQNPNSAEDVVYYPIKNLELLEIVKELNKVFGDQAPGSSQVETMYKNQTGEEKEMKGVKEVMEKVAEESERMKNLMEELYEKGAQQCKLMEGLVDWVYELQKTIERIERRDEINMKNFERRGEIFS